MIGAQAGRMARAGVALGLAAAAVLGISSAGAAVIRSTPGAALSATPLAVSFGGGAATYAFTAASTGNGPGAAVATSGTAQVSNLGGLTDFGAGASIDQTGELYTFTSFPTATTIPFSAADDFIGLAFILGDGRHFGYAEVAGATLVSYAYESTPGAGILTGAAGTATVPEPGTATLLAAGLAGVAAAGRWRRVHPRPQ